jgi:HSP20 family protein
VSERRYGSFERSFRLPEGIDEEKIDAHFAKGLLTIRLPKTEEALQKEKRIAIKTT